jgi:hypothetical protein
MGIMRQALRTKGRQRQVSTVQSVPAPIGGWNARDALANMEVTDAVKLENWFPTTTDCVIRGGQAAYATGITGSVETLAVYTAMDGTEQFFAATDSDMYDISSSGAATDELLAVTNGSFQHLNMGDGTNNWLLMYNGTDAPKYYNGATWVEVTGATAPALTGITPTAAIAGVTYHGRLILLEKDTLSFWYLPAGAVGGLAVEFDLSPFAKRGGYLMWAATWSHDAGDGLDDYIVFMTSEGEAIIYAGTDPATAANWVKKGTYFLGKPLGRRSYVQFGGDLLAVTQEGVFNMSEGLKYARINERVAITDKIKDAFNVAARNVGTAFGWDATHYPLKNAILFNIPISAASEQYVVNTITGSWCKFTGWDTDVLAIYNDELYYGGSTVVQKAWTGVSDAGSNIVAEGKTAFNNFGSTSQNKRLTMYRPMLQTNGVLAYLTDVEVDFNETDITGVASYTPSTAGTWDSATWDSGAWQGGLATVRNWTTPDAPIGYYMAAKIKIETNSTQVHWIANDYVIENGGII